MESRFVRGRLALALLVLLAVPSFARAQSAISGVVRDTTGAVMPGVTVETASPVLIEKVRTAVSDDQGRYSVIDLRPGTYTVTFTLTGFNTFRREGLELPGDFTATVNAELRVGALEESVTVTGAAPLVDVQNTQRTHVLSREQLDSLPSARNYSGLAALLPGVRMTNTDVGGNQQVEQIYMITHGSRRTDTSLQVDGMSINSLMNDGEVQAYFSDAANAEVTYQTSGAGAEVSTGGVRINMIPREGGNRYSGSLFFGGSSGTWQGDNVTPALKARGLAAGNRVDLISDFNVGLGGPIKKDALWFFPAGGGSRPTSSSRTRSSRTAHRAGRSSGCRISWSASPGRSRRATSSRCITTAIRSTRASRWRRCGSPRPRRTAEIPIARSTTRGRRSGPLR